MRLIGEVIDSGIRLGELADDADGNVTASTPEAAAILKQLRTLSGLDGTALLEAADGWSNGYVRVASKPDAVPE